MSIGMRSPQEEWLRCEPWLQAALDEAGNVFDLGDVLQRVVDDQARFWPGRVSAAVTEVVHFPKAMALRCWLAGGDMDEIVGVLMPRIEAYGRAIGCTRFLISGRKGWERVLRDHGYLPKYHTLEKVMQ